MAGQATVRERRWAGRLRWIYCAPLLLMLTLGAWSFASPVGAGPDDDFHLASVWCSRGGTVACTPGQHADDRMMSVAFRNSVCYARIQSRSAHCQDALGLELDGEKWLTNRGNFHHDYPAPYYATMRVFAGDDLTTGALTMRLVNSAVFVALATALAFLLAPSRRQTLLWGWLVSLIPLGMFLVASNNPSGWSITGVGTTYLAALGWFETRGRRRLGLAALYLVGVLMAAGSRADAGLYAVGASIIAGLLTFEPTRQWRLAALLPLAGVVLALALFASTDIGGVAMVQPDDGGGVGGPGEVSALAPTAGVALAIYNLMQLPDLWTGIWGTWGLGWLDTPVPAVVPWGMAVAFALVVFAGLSHLNLRKAICVGGVVAVLVALPVFLLTRAGNRVGEVVQPRYFLPLLLLLALVALTALPGARVVRLTRVQTAAILVVMAAANSVSLQVNIRRYVTGTDHQGLNLDAGKQWWWHDAVMGPTAVWALGSAAFAGLLVVLWPLLRRWTVGNAAVGESRTGESPVLAAS